MKDRIKYIFLLLLIVPNIVFAAGMTVSKTSVTIEEGSKASFKISLKDAAGKIIISSSDTNVATVNKSKIWLDKSSDTITIKALKVGKCTVTISTDDVTTYDDKDLVVTKKITVNVINKRSSNNNLSSLKVDGKLIDGFSSSKESYSITTDKKSVTISATASDSKAKVSGTGTKTLTSNNNKYNIKVTAENGSTKTYSITVNNNSINSTTNVQETVVTEYSLKYDEESFQYCKDVVSNTIIAKQDEPWGILCEPQRDDYYFNGWYTSNTGGKLITERTLARDNIIVYAHWNIAKTNSNSNNSFKLNSIVIIITSIISFLLGAIFTYLLFKKHLIRVDK